MAKIVEAIRPNAEQRIAAEQRAIADVEAEIAGLEQQRAETLLADDAGDALKLADKITAARRRLETHHDRIKALAAQGRRDKIERRQQQKAEALAVFEAKFAERFTAADRLDRAIEEFSAAVLAYGEVCRAPFAAWSDTFPSIKMFEGYSQNYAAGRIAGALRIEHAGAAWELLTRLPARLSKLGEHDRAIAASIADDIRNAPLPPQYNAEDEAA